jgi:hypothetical protein
MQRYLARPARNVPVIVVARVTLLIYHAVDGAATNGVSRESSQRGEVMRVTSKAILPEENCHTYNLQGLDPAGS